MTVGGRLRQGDGERRGTGGDAAGFLDENNTARIGAVGQAASVAGTAFAAAAAVAGTAVAGLTDAVERRALRREQERGARQDSSHHECEAAAREHEQMLPQEASFRARGQNLVAVAQSFSNVSCIMLTFAGSVRSKPTSRFLVSEVQLRLIEPA